MTRTDAQDMWIWIARFKRALAALVTALAVGVVGVEVVAPETAQAAGVVVGHVPLGSTKAAPPRED
jgi:hypothetical protein